MSRRKSRGLVKALFIILIELYIAIPSPINIINNFLKLLFQFLPLCPGSFCSTESFLFLIPAIIGVVGLYDSFGNDLKSLTFIKEQIRKGNFL
ncbi:MAG: hypothetical protein ABIA76_01870 [Candidatus Diapherotrites archaeon]